MESNNIYVDTKNYCLASGELVNRYFTENIERMADSESRYLHVVPYTHQLFQSLFLMKIVVLENYTIPLFLDYHYEKFLNTSLTKANPKISKKLFLDLLEFKILKYLDTNSPFQYIEKGFVIVDWLREKRRKLKSVWPITHTSVMAEINTLLTNEQEDKLKEIIRIIKHYYSHMGIDINTIGSVVKRDIVVMILLMNEKNFFGKDILGIRQQKLKKYIKTMFEDEFNNAIGQALEPSKIKMLKIEEYKNKRPFNLIK